MTLRYKPRKPRICPKCGKLIQKGEPAQRTLSKTYHKSCFESLLIEVED